MPSVSTSRVNTPSLASLATKGCSCSAGPAHRRHAQLRHARFELRASRTCRQGLRCCSLDSLDLHSWVCTDKACSRQSQVS